MKWTFVIQQKLKVAVLLGVVMFFVVVFNLILQKNISDINRSVNSIYNDRLIPATDMFYLSDNFHHRQLAIEKFLFTTDYNTDQLRSTLDKYDKEMFALISKYEKTYLVEEESVFLKKFKEQVRNYSGIEREILSLSEHNKKTEALNLYESDGRASLEATIKQLSDLTTIQSAVGGKLVSDTKGIVATSNFLSDLQLVLAIVIGAIITALVLSSKVINRPQERFNLN